MAADEAVVHFMSCTTVCGGLTQFMLFLETIFFKYGAKNEKLLEKDSSQMCSLNLPAEKWVKWESGSAKGGGGGVIFIDLTEFAFIKYWTAIPFNQMACVLCGKTVVSSGEELIGVESGKTHPISQLPITAICAFQLQSHRLQSVLTVLSNVTVWQYIEAKGPTYVQCLPLPSAVTIQYHPPPIFFLIILLSLLLLFEYCAR